ncbi:MAG: hypothetical protein KAH38_11300, partial [Candidatus Hydrogenedentes bacterium]|nr:hypothetical protein [Candidatus Hydrogenedentota bacterium]
MHNRSGHFWQNRFYSCSMDAAHTLQALCYTELNPVKATMAMLQWEYPWSSAAPTRFQKTKENGKKDKKRRMLFINILTIPALNRWLSPIFRVSVISVVKPSSLFLILFLFFSPSFLPFFLVFSVFLVVKHPDRCAP